MNKLFGLDEWTLSRKISPDKRMAFATVYLKYPDWKTVSKYKLADRKEYRDNYLKTNFKKLLDKNYFDSNELIGTKRKPGGIKATISLAALHKLSRLTFIESIFIKQLDGAKRKPEKPTDKFFCVKMTVAIQVEGITSGIQKCENRYILIKANSHDDAYKKVAKTEGKYCEPYLNSDLRLVRWKVESYDDSYEAWVGSAYELNSAKGVEVFSKFFGRRITKERVWDVKV